jgi:fibronectin type 3 domain-containing protein
MKKFILYIVLLFSIVGFGSQQKATRQISIPVLIQHNAVLSWTDNDTGVAFHIYRSTTSGSGYTMISISPVTTKTYTDSTIQSGTTYYYVITAFDPNTGQESGYSNEVAAVIPNP